MALIATIDARQIKEALTVDLRKDERPLDLLMQLWEEEETETEENISIEAFGKIEVASQSRVFKKLWDSNVQRETESHRHPSISLHQLHDKIYRPTIDTFTRIYEALRNMSMQVEEFDEIFGESEVDFIKDELKVMGQSFADSMQTVWITPICDYIKRYRKLQDVVEPARTVYALQEGLELTGDFSPLSDFQIDRFRAKCLKDFSEEMETTGAKLKVLDNLVVCLLEELLNCVSKDFISWIRSIMKDQKELTVFVELATAFAGDNPLDIDKVRNFRDAVFACAPIIYDLDKNAGFDDLMEKIKSLKEFTDKDADLQHKLRDSCVHKPWLETAHAAHGSVAKSSLLQATEINKNGVYIIKQSSTRGTVKLDDCISLNIGERSSGNQNVQYKTYNLSQLQELQNKLMLITATDEQTDSISLYVKVLEQILHAGELLIKLTEAGHILFTDWALRAYCDDKHAVKVHIDFGLTGMAIQGHGKLLVELTGVCKSMQDCLDKWLTYTTKHRDEYYFLNYFTAKQLVTLCCAVANLQKNEEVPTGVLNLLSFIKENVTEKDLRDAFTAALKTPLQNPGSVNLRSPQIQDYLVTFPEIINYVVQAGYSEDAAKAAVMYCKSGEEGVEDFQEAVMECVYEYSTDDDWVKKWSTDFEEERENVLQNQMKFSGGHSPEQMQPTFSQDDMINMFENLTSCKEKITILWETYCGKLSGLVSDKYAGLDLVGETLKQLAETEKDTVQRTLTRHLERGKPNLVSCSDVEMLPHCLSLYLSEERPLPTFDEILICTSETTAEEVELIIRRAVQPGSRHEKIYSLLNADKLNHEVSRALESSFYHFSQSQDVTVAKDYNFVIFCNAKAHHSYVLTAFDEYRRTVPSQTYGGIQKLLRVKHALSPEAGFTSIIPEKFQQSIKMIASARAGMGKTLFVNNLVKRSSELLKDQGFTHKTISLTESEIKPGYIFEQLRPYEDKPEDKVPRVFHFDVPPVVCKGLYSFLVQLFVLRCFQSTDGSIWRCKDCHLYLVEFTERKPTGRDSENSEMSTEMKNCLLGMFTTVRCLSPKDTEEHLSGNCSTNYTQNEFQVMDGSEFKSETFQRTYQYLKHFRQNKLEQFKFDPKVCADSPKEWLECILHFCEIKDPSWMELRNFTHFLNVQLEKCENSVFCSDVLRNDLTGFRAFVVKFMITMSRDFTMPSLKTSDESDLSGRTEDENILRQHQLERRWEQHSHPYIMFNADGVSMTFLGFHIQNLNAVDVHSGKVIEPNIITRQLLTQLKYQGVPLNIDFNNLARADQLEILCRVLGVTRVKDPDESYQLTLDNVLKILAIHMRFQCNIPVIIMGETGCGKTRLVQFMCDLLRTENGRRNMIVVRVHGGTISEEIYKKVQQAIQISQENEALGMDTVLFFDEANSTEAVYAIKEVICDKTVNGCKIDAPRLKFVAACNPYRKHTQQAIEQLEKAGLGYRVRAEDTREKLGTIPMRQLVYRVQPLPPSLSPLVWDFGKLNEHTQDLYITQMVRSFFKRENLPEKYETVFTKVISVSQRHIAGIANECRMVSLRDIERCMKTVMWFHQQRTTLYPLIDQKKERKGPGNVSGSLIDDIIRSLILAVGVCYNASLERREKYIEKVAEVLSLTTTDIINEIDFCQEVFIDNVDLSTTATAKNDALKENVFMMIVCMNLRLPLFLVGKPGSSKSLSKTIAADALQGKSSGSDLFRSYKQVQLLSFQCSAHSTSDGIISTFRQCAQLQLNQNLEEYVSVVVLDEIGLAEDSPTMPLKTLHPLLEGGYIDDEEPKHSMKVGFIGISNWSLDPAKMNRGILLLRISPGEHELIKTAKEICTFAKPTTTDIEENIPKLTKVYSEILKEAQSHIEFYGLRDYYSLIKVIVTYARMSSHELSVDALARAVQRNFGGLDSQVKILEIFNSVFQTTGKPVKTIDLVKENLDSKKRKGLEPRYLLLLTSNNAALSILQSLKVIDKNDTEIIFGSGFPLDQEYSQVCRTVNRVKTCMEAGRPVVLLNIQSLYESLYDALNQCYVKLGGSNYVDIGLGSHRVKCKVRDEFRLIVIEEKSVVYSQFPAPLLSRLEKHCLEMSTILSEDTREMLGVLENQVKKMFSSEGENRQTLCDTLIGFSGDTMASVLLQYCRQSPSECWDSAMKNDVIQQAKEKVIQCATLDSILRVTRDREAVQELYFTHQTHINLTDLIRKHRTTSDKGMCLEVSTYSRLLNQRDFKSMNTDLKISKHQSHLFRLREFQTEQAFCDALRKCFQLSVEGRLLVLIQFYFENPNQSQRLLSCTRYCISKLVREFQEKTIVDVILLIRIPRISGGCGYTALIGDDWDCTHLDELIPTKGLTSDMQKLCSMSIPEIFKKSMVCSKVVLVELAANMYKDLTKDDPENVSLLWLHVTYENMHDNHQILYKLSQQCSDQFDISKAREATEATHLLLEKLQPSDELLRDYPSCKDWLKRMIAKKKMDMELTFKEVTRMLKQCNINACNIYLLDEMGKHLQRYIEEALKHNENPEEFYLMVVRSTEDQIQTSSHEALIQKAIECLNFDTSMLSSPGRDVTFEDLHCIAKIRFAVTVASDIIGRLKSVEVLVEGSHGGASILIQRLEEIVMKNQWIQIFLIRNLCNVFGLKIIQHILQNENLHWILPKELRDKKIAQVHKKSTQYRNWKNISVVCQRLSQESLTQLSEKLSFSHDSSLTPVVIHTAAVIYQSTAPEMNLLKTLCTQPNKVMNNVGDILVNILYSKTPQLTDLPTTGIFNLPLMWRYEQRMTIQHLTHLVELGDGTEGYPALLELLRKHGHIQHIRHLPQILNLQLKLMLHFRYTDLVDLKDMSVEEFLTKAPPAESHLLKEGVKRLMSVWRHLKDSSYLEIPPDLKQREEDSIMIPDLLPRENSLTRILTRYLAKMQNDCINTAKIKESGQMKAEDLKPSHIITCDLEEDFLPMAISNFGHIVNEDGTETTNYNFKTLESQLISRFISEKPLIDLSTLPLMECNPVSTLQSFFSKVKSNLEPLPAQEKSYIMNEMRFLSEISAALSTLRIAIGFLELSFGSKDMLLVEYMKTELRMEDRAQHLELPVLRTSQVKHIQSLWETLSTRRSALLTEMNQDPFFMVSPKFHEKLSEEEKRDLVTKLSEIKDLDMFLTQLHDFIMNMEAKPIMPFWEFNSTFEAFLFNDKELPEDCVTSLIKPFGDDLKMKNIISLWGLSVRRRAGHVNSVFN
ncbi:E3 ubiquitin-protein ligase rnf213-alpha-like [Chanos chanos]|uniref:E3 ubiquitin-protein ligase rnf213-alpha-like n=1 Tax=Chanos chanos TaxID=29144 RepID=A0A6J2VKX1_CHACN|nr:E3 ubiquitin-protein ligase rnf213-alpha-like [Chanos chanos]